MRCSRCSPTPGWSGRISDPYKATGSLANLWKLPKGLVMQPEAIDLKAMGRDAAWSR
jgi:hypothetical protein